jgi:signal transduction histidine kinase
MAEQNDMNVYLVLIAGTEAMMLLVVGFILFIVIYQKRLVRQQEEKQQTALSHQRELNEASIQVTEAERYRIATDLHDEIGHALLLLRMQASTTGNSAQSRLIDTTLQKVRQVSYDLYPPGLNVFGLAHALDDLFEQAFSPTAITVESDCTQLPAELTPATQLAFYRIVQELVSNTIRYSKATSITFHFLPSLETLVMSYRDNGCGFDVEEKARGLGLRNIENRALAAGGNLMITTAPGNGFRAEITIPMPSQK